MQASSLPNEQVGSRKCSVCVSNGDMNDQAFSTADSLWAHIATIHLLWVPFECTLCPMMFLPTEGVLKKHYESTHPGKVPRAVYTYAEAKTTEIRQIFLESQKLSDTSESNKQDNSDAEANSKTATFTAVLGTVTPESDQMDISEETPEDTTIASSNTENEEEREENNDEGKHFLQTTGNFDHKSKEGMPSHVTSIVNGQSESIKCNPNTSEDQQPILQPYQESESNDRDDNAVEEEPHREISQETKNECSFKSDQCTTQSIFTQPIGLPLPAPKARRQSVKKERYVWCGLCESQTTSAESKHLHIWCHHMDGVKRYSCTECDYRTVAPIQMKAHVRHKHKELTGIVWIDHTAELKPQYLRQYAAAFGQHSPLQSLGTFRPLSPIKHQDVPDCNLCSRAVSRIHRGVHIWRSHMSRKRYVCVHCACGSPLLADISKHVRLKHGIEGDGTNWTDNSRLLYDEYEQQYTAAYGSYIAKNYSGVAV